MKSSKRPLYVHVQTGLLVLLAMTLLYPIPAFVLEWDSLVKDSGGYGFLPGALVLCSGMTALAYLTLQVALKSHAGRIN